MAEEFAPGRAGQTHTIRVRSYGGMELTFIDIDGWAVFQGDMILGRTSDLLRLSADDTEDLPTEEGIGSTRAPLIARTPLNRRLWPNAVVPFEINANVNAILRNQIEGVQGVGGAINHYEANTNLRFRPAVDDDDGFIEFLEQNEKNAAEVGYQDRRQFIWLDPNAPRGVVIHEIGHAIGAWHEHSRGDRDVFIDILWNNILDTNNEKDNFQKHLDDGQDLGPYDLGSIMHYDELAFGKDDDAGNKLQTIRPRDPLPSGVDMGQRIALSAHDIAQIRRLYPDRENFVGGTSWGSDTSTTSIAFGDVDGDGRDEVGITRHANQNARFWILDDADNNFRELFAGGENWGRGNYATSIAFGDVDGDGRDEVGITRHANVNARFWILDDFNNQFGTMHEGGSDWGHGNYATSIAFGDVDGDGRDEVALARRASKNSRIWVLNDANSRFGTILGTGTFWGSGRWATFVSLGNSGGGAAVAHLGIGRNGGRNARFLINDIEV